MAKHRIYTTSFASVYPLYVAKAERKGRSRDEVDRIICWLTGYDRAGLPAQIDGGADFETFFAEAPSPNPSRALLKGVVRCVRVEEIAEPTMRVIRTLDQLGEAQAEGRAWEEHLRGGGGGTV